MLIDALNLQFGSALQKLLGGGGQKVIPQDVAERMMEASMLQDPVSIIRPLQGLEAMRAVPATFARYGLGAGLGSAAANSSAGGRESAQQDLE